LQLPSDWQASPVVQALPSSQLAPELTSHLPLVALQVPGWHASAAQVFAVPLHEPSAWQVPPVWQGVESVQLAPTLTAHAPVDGSHEPE
jgi:hypothetical protein